MVENWQDYQEVVGTFFRQFGCSVEVNATIQGARARHKIDVLVRFDSFGIRQTWVIECKFWKQRVPKEKVLTLIGVCNDVGADRGILLSESGHQSGAVAASKATNVTLMSLNELRQSASDEIAKLRLECISDRLLKLNEKMSGLYTSRKSARGYIRSLKTGVAFEPIGVRGHVMANAALVELPLGVLEAGVKAVRLGKNRFPFDWSFPEDKPRFAVSVDEFFRHAKEKLDTLERLIEEQVENVKMQP